MDFKLEPLCKGLGVFVSKQHTFGTDAFLLSHFSNVKKSDVVCDLGTGCGIIPLLWFKPGSSSPKSVLAVDIQEMAIRQLTKTVNTQNITAVTPLCQDLKTLSKDYNGTFSLVTCNPPYYNGGIVSKSQADKLARHETACELNDIVKTASRLLKFGGRFCVCQKPERLADVIDSMRKNSLEPKRLTFVVKNTSDAPWLVLVEGKKGAKPFLKVTPPVVMYNQDGEYTDFIKKLYWGE